MMGQTNGFGNRPNGSARRRPAATSSQPISAVFVYGTLRRGGCRGRLWPAAPLRVEPAWTRGALFTRRDYPAMTAGVDRVLGERWQFDPAVMPRVMARLDEIEGANQPGQADLYRRVIVDLFAVDDRPLGTAYGYLYAVDPASDGFRRLRPAEAECFVQWSAEAPS